MDTRQIPLRDFFKNPQEAGHQVSPDGKYISYLASYERRLNVFVKPIGGEAMRVTNETARDIGGYFWKGDRILYVKDFGGDENYHVVSVNLRGEDLKDLTPGENVQAQMVDRLIDDDAHIIVAHNRRNAEVFDVFRIDIVTGKKEVTAQNPGSITFWTTDHEGKLRVAIETDGVNQTLLYRDKEEDSFQAVLTTSFKESVEPLFFTFDNQRLYVSSNRGRDKAAIFAFDPRTSREEELLFEHPDVDVAWMTYSHKRKVLTSIAYTTWKTEFKFLDPVREADYETVKALLPDMKSGSPLPTRTRTNSSSRPIAIALPVRSTLSIRRRVGWTSYPTRLHGCLNPTSPKCSR